MQANYGANEISTLLSKVKIFNREIGSYEMFAITNNFDYVVKLSNGKIFIKLEELQDDSKDALTPDRLTEIANRFVSATAKTTTQQQQTTQAPQPISNPVTSKKKSSTGKRILIIVSIIVLTLIGLFVLNQLQHEKQMQNEQSQKANIRNNITSYVTASRSGYTYNELGGISNLSITVANSTGYILDNVRVKVSYIKTNGGIWKNEYIDFNLIEAYGKQTLKAPDSERGTSVDYSIVSIKSNALGLY